MYDEDGCCLPRMDGVWKEWLFNNDITVTNGDDEGVELPPTQTQPISQSQHTPMEEEDMTVVARLVSMVKVHLCTKKDSFLFMKALFLVSSKSINSTTSNFIS